MDAVLQRWLAGGWTIAADSTSKYGSRVVFIEREAEVVVLSMLKSLPSPEVIRLAFASSPHPIMFIVHSSLIAETEFLAHDTLLALHALYYGRVYAYEDDGTLWAVHFERLRGNSRNPDWRRVEAYSWDFIDTEVDCLLAWFPGRFRIARPFDKKWWNVQQEPPRQQRARANRKQPQTKSAWDILGVPSHASMADIKRAYRKLAKVWHPDLNKSPEANERMQEINVAYQYAMDWIKA